MCPSQTIQGQATNRHPDRESRQLHWSLSIRRCLKHLSMRPSIAHDRDRIPIFGLIFNRLLIEAINLSSFNFSTTIKIRLPIF